MNKKEFYNHFLKEDIEFIKANMPTWDMSEIQWQIDESLCVNKMKSETILQNTIGGQRFIDTHSRFSGEINKTVHSWIQKAKNLSVYEKNIDKTAEDLEYLVLPETKKWQMTHKVWLINSKTLKYETINFQDIEAMKE